MSNYWQANIKINQEVTKSQSIQLSTNGSPFGDFDDTAQPFGESEDIKDVISQILFYELRMST